MLRRGRPKAKPMRSITASAQPIPLNDPRKAVKLAGRRQVWQDDAWQFFDEMGEVKFTVWWAGNAISQVRIFPAIEGPDGEMIPVDDPDSGVDPHLAAAAIDELDRLKSSQGGHPEILRRMNMNLDVAGEGYLIGTGARPEKIGLNGQVTAPATTEEWDVKSVSEVTFDQNGTVVHDYPGDTGRRLDPILDTCIRIWNRHPRWSNMADSGVRGILGDCEALLTFTAEQMAQSRSRHNAGLLLLPNGLSTGRKTTHSEAEDEDDDTDPLTAQIVEGLTTPTDDPGAEGAVAPSILRGDSDDLKEVRWIDLGRKAAADLDDRIEKRVQRVARGLNAPVEVVMGHQQTTFANAEQVDEDEFDDYHRPRCLLVVDGLTAGYLQPNLIARLERFDPTVVAIIRVWFDPSALISAPAAAENADKAYEMMTISAPAYRRYKGFREDDAPDPDEILARIGAGKGRIDPDVAVALLKLIGDFVVVPGAAGEQAGDVTPAPPGKPIEATLAPPDATVTALVGAVVARIPGLTDDARRRQYTEILAGMHPEDLVRLATRPALTAGSSYRPRGRGGSHPVGRALMDIDRELRTRLLTLADATMAAALERAGNRIRAKAGTLRDLTAQVEPRLRAAHVGRPVLTAAGLTPEALLADAFESMKAKFMEWGAAAQHDALELASRVSSGFSIEQRAALQLRQANDLEEAWTWLDGTLTTLAEAKLFAPDLAADELQQLGEISNTMVPPGAIREAISRAGGATSLTTTPGGGAYVTVADDGTRPAGGIGTGDLLRDAMRDMGVGTEGYVWSYGPGSRKTAFEPHLDLDGVQFVNFDDDVLANSDSFPETAFYLPGDHDGCQCDVEPIIIPPDDTSSGDQ